MYVAANCEWQRDKKKNGRKKKFVNFVAEWVKRKKKSNDSAVFSSIFLLLFFYSHFVLATLMISTYLLRFCLHFTSISSNFQRDTFQRKHSQENSQINPSIYHTGLNKWTKQWMYSFQIVNPVCQDFKIHAWSNETSSIHKSFCFFAKPSSIHIVFIKWDKMLSLFVFFCSNRFVVTQNLPSPNFFRSMHYII